jgi:hypothetical protein
MKHLNHYDIINEGFLGSLYNLTSSAAGDALKTALPKTSEVVGYVRDKAIDQETLDRLKKQVEIGVKKLKANAISKRDFINHISNGLKKILRQNYVLNTSVVTDVIENVEKSFKYSKQQITVDLRHEKTNIIEDFLTDIYKGCIQRYKGKK